MPKRVQMVRHTESAANLYVGLEGQLTVDKTNGEIRAHDGSTAGGVATARKDLANVSAATSGNDGKMTSTQVGNLEQVISDLDDLETLVAALDGDDIAFDDTDLLVTAATVQAALEAYDAIIVALDSAVDTHIADTENPHSVTAAQAGALAIASDLSDLNDAPTALGNLGLTGDDSIWGAGTETDPKAPSPANVRAAINSFLNWPAGVELIYGNPDGADGLIALDGSALSRTTYSALFSVYGTTHGEGDGSTTFNLPNYEKKFPLGADGTTDYSDGDTGGAFEITQTEDQVGHHGHETRISERTDGENDNQAATGGLRLDLGTPLNNKAAYSGTPDSTAGHQVGQNQAEASVDPMDITNPYIARTWFVTTGGV